MLDVNYPVTINDDAAADHTLAVARELIGADRTMVMPSPVMGAEDWSYVLQAVPGSMAFLGAAPPGVRRPAPNHSNHMVIDEPAMATGIALYAAMAMSPPPGG
jgi:hippurate hydrolase